MPRWAILIAAIGGIGLAGPADAVEYTITDLGALGTSSAAFAVNDSGQVVGTNYFNATWRGFLWSDGVMIDLPTRGGQYTEAKGINNAGTVVGLSGDATGYFHAVTWSASGGGAVLTDLGAGGRTVSYGWGINDAGTVVGQTEAPPFFYGSAVHDENGWTTLPEIKPGYGGEPGPLGSQATAINDQGWIVGNGYLGQCPSGSCWTAMRAFLYKDGGVINLGLPAGFEQVGVKGINASGLIVGQASRPGGITHPVYYDYSGDGVFVDMGSFRGSNGIAESVNDAGQIVGGANGTAFLWEDGAYSDLNDLIDSASGWQLQYAADINNVGQIVGQGLIGGVQHAFLLTPLSEAPEPATWAMMIVGFGMVGAVMRRQGKVRVAFG